MSRTESADLEELAACLDHAERLSLVADRTVRRERGSLLRRLDRRDRQALAWEIRCARDRHPGWPSVRWRQRAHESVGRA